MRVFRVMHPETKKGPYNDGSDAAWDMCMRHTDNHRTPPPWADGLGGDRWSNQDKVYAFASLDHARSWFADDIAELSERGYRLASADYDVPPEHQGKHQCVVPPEVFTDAEWSDVSCLTPTP
jgi:hypothetical protein